MSENKKQKLENKFSIVGLAGKAGSGKNTAADSVAFSDYKQFAFASPIKKIAQIMFHLEDKHLYDNVVKEQIILNDDGSPKWYIEGVAASPRLMFQWLGTKMRTEVASDYFVKSMNEEIKKEIKKATNENKEAKIIITDVRFPNEAEFIRKMGGLILKIERPSVITTTELTEHESEKDLPSDLIDRVIYNDGTIGDLRYSLSRFRNFVLNN